MNRRTFYALMCMALLGLGILMLSAWDMQNVAAATETDGWMPDTPMLEPLMGNLIHCTDMAGSFYMLGGLLEGNAVSDHLSRFDLADHTWKQLADMPAALRDPATVCYQGRLYVAGGKGELIGKSLYIYDIEGGYWLQGPDLPDKVWGAAIAAWDDKLYLVGGTRVTKPFTPERRVDVFDIATGTWTVAGGQEMPVAASFFSSAQLGQYLYTAGGFSGDLMHNVNQTQRYDMLNNTWQIGPTFTSARAMGEMKASNSHLYMVGGDQDGYITWLTATDLVEVLDLSTWPTGEWVDMGQPLPVANLHPGLTCTDQIDTGKLWLVGGADTQQNPYEEVYTLDIQDVCSNVAYGDLLREEQSLGNHSGGTVSFVLPVFNAGSHTTMYDVDVASMTILNYPRTFGPIPAGETRLLVVEIPAGAVSGTEGLTKYQVTINPQGRPELKDTALLTSEISDWQEASSIPSGVAFHSVARCVDDPDGFYVIGGSRANLEPVDDVWHYNATHDIWFPVTHMPVAQWGMATTCYEGKLYVAGGFVNTLYSFDLTTNTWQFESATPRGFFASSMGAWNGKLFIAGGDIGGSTWLDIYDLATQSWSHGPEMPAPVGGAGTVQAGPYLYMVGGSGPDGWYGNQNTTLRLDMQLMSWSIGPEFTSRRMFVNLGMTANHLYAIGGDTNGFDRLEPSGMIEVLDLRQWPDGAWEAVDELLPAPVEANLGGCTVKTTTSGRVWSVGGAYGIWGQYEVIDGAFYLETERCPAFIVGVPADLQGTGEIGEATSYQLTITNHGDVSDYYQLSAVSDWTVASGLDGFVGPVAPRQSVQVEIVINVPDDIQPEEIGVTEVTVTSLSDPAVTDVTRISTEAMGWYSSVKMPLGLALSAHVQCVNQPNYLYILGGANGYGAPSRAFYRYDIIADQWMKLSDLPEAAYGISAICVQGKIYAIDWTTSLKIYNISFNEWASEPGVPRVTEGAALGYYKGKLYLVGGTAGENYQATSQVDIYDIARHAWRAATRAPMPMAADYAGSAQIGKYLYVVGGMSSIYQSIFMVQRYDMANNTWEVIDYPNGMVFPTVVVTTKYVYVLGGDPPGDQAWTASELVERFDVNAWPSPMWELVGYHLRNSLMGASGFCTEGLMGGEIWQMGGGDAGNGLIYSDAYYRPAEACWVDPMH